MKNKNVQNSAEITDATPRSGRIAKGLARAALAVGLVSGAGLAANTVHEARKSAASAQAQAADALNEARQANAKAIEANSRAENLQEQVAAQQKEFDYTADLAGLDADVIREHISYPEIPYVTDHISSEVAARQDAATMYLLNFDLRYGESENMVGSSRCTVVKTGDGQLTSAAHCFGDGAITDNYEWAEVPVKGGGEMTEPDSFLSASEWYVSNIPMTTLGEARQNAARVSGFNRNYQNYDAAVLSVESAPQWFQDVQPLTARNSPLTKGETMRVSGYPEASPTPVTAEGIVLGTAPAADMGYAFSGNLTFVGIRPTAEELDTCSFGGSGEGAVDKDGRSFGALASVFRSYNPPNSPKVTPLNTQMQKLEDYIKFQVAGTDYIICGFSEVPEMPIKPLITDPSQFYSEMAPFPDGK